VLFTPAIQYQWCFIVEQRLVHTCSELDDRKANKESIFSAVNAVSVHDMHF